MIGLGFSVNIKQDRPRVLCVRCARDEHGGVQLQPILEHWAVAGEDSTLQLRNLATRVETLLTTEVANAVVVRRMDYAGTVKREVVGRRGQAEGVIAAVARGRVANCRLEPGAGIAHIVGLTKAELEADVAGVIGVDYKEAGAAARAALALAEL